MTEKDIKRTFDEIHMPPDLLGKVEDAMDGKRKKSISRPMKFAAALAVLAVCLLATNGICFAATGDSLFGRITMYVNGEEVNLDDVTLEKNGDTVTATIDNVPEDGDVEIALPGSGKGDFEVSKEGDKIFLLIGGGEQKLDITEDMADKKAEGEFTWKGVVHHYRVTGEGGEYQLSVNTEKK